MSLGVPGEFDSPKFKKAIDKVVAAATRHGKALGRLVPTVEQGIELYGNGFDFICYSGDVWVLHNALAEAVGKLKALGVSTLKRSAAFPDVRLAPLPDHPRQPQQAHHRRQHELDTHPGHIPHAVPKR